MFTPKIFQFEVPSQYGFCVGLVMRHILIYLSVHQPGSTGHPTPCKKIVQSIRLTEASCCRKLSPQTSKGKIKTKGHNKNNVLICIWRFNPNQHTFLCALSDVTLITFKVETYTLQTECEKEDFFIFPFDFVLLSFTYLLNTNHESFLW